MLEFLSIMVCLDMYCTLNLSTGSVPPKLAGFKRRRSKSAVSSAGSQSRGRSTSTLPRDVSGVRDVAMLEHVVKKHRLLQRQLGRQGKQGEWDHTIHSKKPKHLFSGKRGVGKTERR